MSIKKSLRWRFFVLIGDFGDHKKRITLFHLDILESLKRGVFYEELPFNSLEMYYKLLQFVGGTVKCTNTINQE